MLKTNYHTHSKFSDGPGTLEDCVIAAINNGFISLGFSDHAPLPFNNDWAIPNAELTNYTNEVNRLKSAYRDRISIKLGLEIDYIDGLMSPDNKHFQDLELDYIIGSVHLIKDRNSEDYLGIDYRKNEIERLITETFNGKASLLVKDYYSRIRSMSDKGGFDIIGHLDVIKKTNIDSVYFDETEDWYRKEIDKTLQCIAENNQIIEINTGQVINDPVRIYPSPWILKMAHEYNIPVMMNSDAHRPDRLDNYFDEAKKIILNAGYTELKILLEKKWVNDRIV